MAKTSPLASPRLEMTLVLGEFGYNFIGLSEA